MDRTFVGREVPLQRAPLAGLTAMQSKTSRAAPRLRFPLIVSFSLSVISSLAACTDDDAGVPDAPDAGLGLDAGPGLDAMQPVSESCVEATRHEDFTWIKANIFTRSCAFGTCHGSTGGGAAGLSLTADLAYRELVNVASTQESGKKRVVPGDCENSYLFHKVTGTNLASGKKPMPPNPSGPWVGLCAEKQQAICRWIKAGARND